MSDAIKEKLQIDLAGRRVFQPLEPVSVAVAWSLDRPPDPLELDLVWRTEGRGTTHRAAAYRRTWGGGTVTDAGAEVIELAMPVGPLSRGGKLISIEWHFALRGGGEEVTLPIKLVTPQT